MNDTKEAFELCVVEGNLRRGPRAARASPTLATPASEDVVPFGIHENIAASEWTVLISIKAAGRASHKRDNEPHSDQGV
jgi:hypothetical protein